MTQVPLNANGEEVYLIAPDGEIFDFTLANHLVAWASFGSPPYDVIASRTYRQDGTTFVDAYAQDRIITIDYQEGPFDVRQDWWDRRRELQAYFRPNRGGLYTFVVQQPERSFSIKVLPDPGLEFNTDSMTDQNIAETIRLRAFDPFWSDIDTLNLELVNVTAEHLVFPITFPIQFGASGVRFESTNLTYNGTAKTFPLITLYGPYNTVSINILPQQAIIRLTQPVPFGEIRIINTDPANASIVDGNGVSRFNELDIASSPLQDFAVLPEPPGINQKLQIIFLGSLANVTDVAVQMPTKYIGI